MTAQYEELTGGEILARLFASAGIGQVYGLASGKLGPLMAAIAREDRLSFLGVRHEASAAMMATGHFAATGILAVCLGETGPGGLNLLSGLGGARANNLAVIAVTSSNPCGLLDPDRGGFSTTSNPRLFDPLMKWSARVSDPARLPELFREALRHALTGTPGPVHIDVPADILAAKATVSLAALDADLDMIVPRHQPAPSPSAISDVMSALASAKRPLLIGGGGAVAADGGVAFRALAETLGIPVLVTQMGIGLLPVDHALLVDSGGAMAGPAACRALREADLIIAIGCRFSSWMWPDGPPEWGKGDRHFVQVDIDPIAIGRNHRVATGIVADAALAAMALTQALQNVSFTTDQGWLDDLKAEREAHRAMLDQLASGDETPIHPAAIAREIGKLLGAAGRVTFDGGHTSFWSNDFTPVASPRTRFHDPGMTHLGFGLPWAIAMKRALPDEQVVCITGDGALGFTIQELDTARRHNLPVIVVVHNNAAFGVIDFAQRMSGFSIGTDLEGTDYAAVARGFGCFGQVVTGIGELKAAFGAAVASGLPAVIDVRCRFEPHPMMAVFGRSTSAPVIGDLEIA